jgi:photosystem II stability/assembly factor-like uncharacterized protein
VNPHRGPGPDEITYYGIDAIDASTAFVYGLADKRGSSVVLKTTDGGQAWSTVLYLSADICGIDFLDASHGVVLADNGRVWVSDDGGVTWEDGPSLYEPPVAGGTFELADAFFLNASTGWVVGGAPAASSSKGVVLLTKDGGLSWSEREVATRAPLTRVVFADARTGWALAGDPDDEESQFELAKTADGGSSWKVGPLEIDQMPTDIHLFAGGRGCMVGATEDAATGDPGPSSILGTDDGGATWKPRARVPVSLLAMTFADAQVGWAVGGASSIYRTEDGGATWVLQRIPDAASSHASITGSIGKPAPRTFAGITLVSTNRGFAPSDNGLFRYERD